MLDPAKQLAAITTLLNSIPDIIFYKDLDGIYRGGNKAWAALAGKPLDQLIGKTDPDLFPMELATLFRAKDREMLASKETRRNEEWGCCQHMCVALMMGLWGWIPGRCMSLLAKIAACS